MQGKSACVWLLDSSSLPNELGNYNVTPRVKETDGHWNGVKLSTDGTDVFPNRLNRFN
ncbi:MAG: hypothetical protein KAX39_08080 [candidate division Zixibacteria bacterium]|nr:hypothetical protein [candidate division Zixibacteria bacterium]